VISNTEVAATADVSLSRPPWSFSYQAGFNQFRVDIVILRRCLDLEDQLEDAAWELLDEDELSKGGLEERLQVTLPGAYIYTYELGEFTDRPPRGLMWDV